MLIRNNSIVDYLIEAEEKRQQVDFLSQSQEYSEEKAYQIQHDFVQAKCSKKGMEVKGYKISMTTPETQALANTHEPAYGTLLSANFIEGPLTISLSDMFEPLIETELIFYLTDDLSEQADEEEIIAKSQIAAGLEVPDSRFKNWFPHFKLMDLISDNGFTGKVIASTSKVEASYLALKEIEMKLFYNGEQVASGMSEKVMGNPATSIKWLVQKLASHGKQLKRGMVISSGTFISPLDLEVGTYEVHFSSVGSLKINVI